MSGWRAEDNARLRGLWEAGVSMRRIGLALGHSRSTVLYRARKIGLPPRPETAMALAAVERVPVVWVQPAMLPVPGPPGVRRMPLRLWLVPVGPVRTCQWPEGPRRHVIFCGEPAVPDRPYCEIHCRVAFVGFGRARGEAGYSWGKP